MDIDEKIKSLKECENCKDIQIKKFTPLKELIDFETLTSDHMKCECGKRPLDIVMSHILKIMIEEEIVPEKATLRRNSPVPLSGLYYSSLNPQFIGEKTLILLHRDVQHPKSQHHQCRTDQNRVQDRLFPFSLAGSADTKCDYGECNSKEAAF